VLVLRETALEIYWTEAMGSYNIIILPFVSALILTLRLCWFCGKVGRRIFDSYTGENYHQLREQLICIFALSYKKYSSLGFLCPLPTQSIKIRERKEKRRGVEKLSDENLQQIYSLSLKSEV
jgi:hypothetical protein